MRAHRSQEHSEAALLADGADSGPGGEGGGTDARGGGDHIGGHGGHVAEETSRSPRASRSSRSSDSLRAWPSAEFNLTLVTQTDVSRLSYLAHGASRFGGPIVAAVLLPSRQPLASVLRGRVLGDHVTLVGVDAAAAAAALHPSVNQSYPINLLRNAALRAVATTHYVVLDVDLWPSDALYDALLAAPATLLRRKYAALVLPAFQLELPPPEAGADQEAVEASAAGAASAAAYYEAAFGQVPATLDELRHCVDAHRCSTFYAASSPETHSSTPYEQWWKAPRGSEVRSPSTTPPYTARASALHPLLCSPSDVLSPARVRACHDRTATANRLLP